MAKEKSLESIEKIIGNGGNPLLSALRENDKKHLFQSNVTTYFHKTGFHLYDYYFGSVINIHDENGKLIRQEPRVGQAAGTFNLFIGNSGSGKAEPVSKLIPTPRGPVPMGEITPGMFVFDRYGNPTKVTDVFRHTNKAIAKITFSDGRTTLCDYDHLWQVTSKLGLFNISSVKSVKEIEKDYKFEDAHGNTRYKYWIPKLEKAVKYLSSKTDIEPYIIGIIAAMSENVKSDNSFILDDYCFQNEISDGVIICKKISELTDFNFKVEHIDICEGIYKYIFYSNDYDRKAVKYVAPENVDADEAKRNCLIPISRYDEMFMEKKGIPDYYIYNDTYVRMEVLKGYCDLKGRLINYDLNKSGLFIKEDNSIIREQIKDIARSLAYDVYDNFQDKTQMIIVSNYRELMAIVSEDTYSYNKLLCGYLASEIGTVNKDDKLFITNIEYDHHEDTQCIMVANEEHLYVTKDYLVTHNTTLAAQIAGNIIRQYKYANVIHFDCENRFDASRCENITKLPSSFFNADTGERYMIKNGKVGLDIIQEMIVKTYVNKMRLKDQLYIDSGLTDEFNKPIKIFEPTIIIIDSITTVLNETFNPDSNKEASEAEKMRGNTEGARDAKSLKGFFKDILPLCKEANIIIFGINHINQNMSMNAFLPVAKQQNYLKQDEIIPGGKTMIYYPYNIVKLTAKPSDDFIEEADGFAGHIVMVEPIKSSSNQSGNNSKGVSFEMVFVHKYGFDSLRSIINYGRQYGMIEGNKTRMKFRDDPSFTFSLKNINQEKNEKPIWESVNKFIVPELKQHLSFIEPDEIEFDSREFDY